MSARFMTTILAIFFLILPLDLATAKIPYLIVSHVGTSQVFQLAQSFIDQNPGLGWDTYKDVFGNYVGIEINGFGNYIVRAAHYGSSDSRR